jgi:hypothetical protein
MKYRLRLLLAAWLIIAGAACTPTAAAPLTARATPHPALVATAQADQYWRDAEATTQARQVEQIALTATFEADLRNVQATAGAGAATVQAQQTREAVAFALTTDAATVQAQQIRAAATAEAQATAVMVARQESEARATAQAQATTAAFTATRQALALEQAAYQARRARLATAWAAGSCGNCCPPWSGAPASSTTASTATRCCWSATAMAVPWWPTPCGCCRRP